MKILGYNRLPGKIPAWVSYDKKRGYIFHDGRSESPTLIGDMSHIFVGNKGSYACFGTPHGEDGPYPRILVKDGKILQQADYFDTGYPLTGFGFSSKDLLSYCYSDKVGKLSLAIDGTTLLSGFYSLDTFHWASDGEQYICFGEKDFGKFLIVNSNVYGSFEDLHHAEFSNDSQHWCGVMRANAKWILLLDGEVIDRVDDFDFATPFRVFTEDCKWCHYWTNNGKKIVYKRTER